VRKLFLNDVSDTNPTSIWQTLFTSIPLPCKLWHFLSIPLPSKMYFFVYPISSVAKKWSHQSSFYLHDKIVNSIQLLRIHEEFFAKSNFYLHYLIFSSIQLLLKHRSL